MHANTLRLRDIALTFGRKFWSMLSTKPPTGKNNKEKEAYISNGINGNLQKPSPLTDKSYINYDPYEHIEHKNPTTYLDTMFHLLKASLGTGILAMPNAFHNAGWLIGSIGTLIIGLLCTYNIHILVNSEYELCKRRKVPSMTFPEVLECSFEEGPQKLRWFAPYAKFLTNLFIVMYQCGSSAIYTVFIADNLTQVYNIYTGSQITSRNMMLWILVPLILICWVRNLKLLVPFSTVANVVTMLSFILIFRYIFDDIPSLKLEDIEPRGTVNGIPLFFGTVLFAMEAIGVIMPLKNEMKKPKKFGSMFGVLNASMVPISLLYAFIGFFGYLKYKSDVKASITLNLPKTEILSNAVRILYSGSIFITYALSCYVAFDIIWINGIKQKITDKKNLVFWEYIVRTGIACFTFIMAYAVPNLELFISFIGAFCLSTIGIAFPAIVQILTHWCHREDTLRFTILVFKNFILILIAIFAFTIGVSTTIKQYIEKGA